MGVLSMEEIILKEYLYMIWRRLWIIIIITFLFIATSGLLSYFVLVPEYETFTTLILGKVNAGVGFNEAIQYNDILLNKQLVNTYGEIAKSRLVSKEVINNLGLDLTAEQLGKKIKVSLVEDTEVIKIIVYYDNPELAVKIANEIAQVFKKNIINIMKIENVQIIDEAEVPANPVKPRPMLNMAVAGTLGMIMSMLLVFFIEYMDNTIKTTSEVDKYLGYPVIGMIPKSKDTELINHSNLKSLASEAYRTLRTNIQFSNIDRNIKSLVITSSGPNEGKSTVISNLAIAIGHSDKKVLLVDADLRKPRIHQIFSAENLYGLTTVLSEAIDYKDIVIPTGIGSLDLLTSGPIPPNPVELLGSNKMKELLEKVIEEYDMVLLDTPPVGILTDAAVLSTNCDGVIMVCAVGQTVIKAAVNSKELLQKVNANILGIVMNKIPQSKGEYKKYYFYNY